MKHLLFFLTEIMMLAILFLPTGFSPGNDRTTASPSPVAEELADEMREDARGLAADLGQVLNQRIGWLRPATVKERAILWVGLAIALPWALLGYLRPLLAKGNPLIQLLCAILVGFVSVYLGWRFWGETVGADQFASTLIIAGPFLMIHYHMVAAGMAEPAADRHAT